MAKEGRSTERRINLAALKKQDPNAENILDTASSVAHYKFDAVTEKWEKTEFEGSMFLYNKNGLEVEVAFLIMNRLNKDNLTVKIKPGMEFKLQEPFLLCRTGSDIIGIWFYDMQECSRISALLSSIAQASGNQQDLANLVQKLTTEIERRETPKKDLMQLFMQAKEEYDKREIQGDGFKKSASMTKIQSRDQNTVTILKRTNSFSEGSEKTSAERDGLTMSASSNVSETNTLMKLLQTTRNTDRKPRSRTLSYGEQIIDTRTQVPSQNSQPPRVGDLFLPLSNGRTEQTLPGDAERPKAIDVAMLEATVLLNSPSKGNPMGPDDAVRSQRKPDATKAKVKPDPREYFPQRVEINNDDPVKLPVTNLITPASMAAGRSTTNKAPVAGVGRGRGLASILNISDKKSDERAQVTSTTTSSTPFYQGDTVQKNVTPKKESGLAMRFPDPPSSSLVSSLMSPMQFKASQKTNTPSSTSKENPNSTLPTQLSKQQFQDALITLLQNDESFVDKLHTSYLNMLSNAKR